MALKGIFPLPTHLKNLEHSNLCLSAPKEKAGNTAVFKLPEWLEFTKQSHSLDYALKVRIRKLVHLFSCIDHKSASYIFYINHLEESPAPLNGTGMSTF